MSVAMVLTIVLIATAGYITWLKLKLWLLGVRARQLLAANEILVQVNSAQRLSLYKQEDEWPELIEARRD